VSCVGLGDTPAQPSSIGDVRIVGEPGRDQISRSFVERLACLTPTQRRLALAHACTLPWRDNPAEVPACFKRELETAAWEARQEDLAREGKSVDVQEIVDPHDPPISEVFLRQIVSSSPTRRRAQLAIVCAAPWLGGSEFPPESISRSFEDALAEATEEHRLQRRGGRRA
jgi:hypothetical protein